MGHILWCLLLLPPGPGGAEHLNSGEYAEHRPFIVDFDPETGALSLDTRVLDPGSDRPGVSMDGTRWPHGFRGDAYAHDAVFSRVTGQ